MKDEDLNLEEFEVCQHWVDRGKYIREGGKMCV
jgi:hypothetical protein